jgi:uncharacterized protein (DUF779 family)
MVPRPVAIQATRQAIARLLAVHGPAHIRPVGRLPRRQRALCLHAGEFLTGAGHVLLGEVEGCPFYIDARQWAAWNATRLVLDVAPGMAEGFSLPAGNGLHFVTRSRA